MSGASNNSGVFFSILSIPDEPNALPNAAMVQIAPEFLISGRLDGRVNLHRSSESQTMGDFLLADFEVFDTPRKAAEAILNGAVLI